VLGVPCMQQLQLLLVAAGPASPCNSICRS
jgi:hypothetical protein